MKHNRLCFQYFLGGTSKSKKICLTSLDVKGGRDNGMDVKVFFKKTQFQF